MSDLLYKDAFDACKKTYSEEHEKAATEAVQAWLIAISTTKVAEYMNSKPKSMLLVASENGYPMVVQQLLKDKELVKVEVDHQAWVLFQKERNTKKGAADDPTPRLGFAQARKVLKAKKRDAESADFEVVLFSKHEYLEWKRKQAETTNRYTSCYDMITLYMNIGEEILDVSNLLYVISKLRDLGWTNMDDITDHWDKVSDKLLDERMEPSLLAKLNEARYNYDSWDKVRDEVRENKEPSLLAKPSEARYCSMLRPLGNAMIVSPIALIPGLVLVLFYDLVHYEEQLWLECFVWLGLFGLSQMVYALLVAPFTGWGMIKEASRDTDLGATLKGSMNVQGLVSTFLFSTIMGRLQVGLNFDLTNNATQVSTLEINSEREIVAMVDTDATEHVLQQWCAICDDIVFTIYS